MSHMPRTASTGSERLPLRRRFAGIIDEDGEPTVGWEVDTRGEWAEKWPACPDGHPLKLRHALGFWERSLRELELRVSLGDDGWGVCQIIVDEREGRGLRASAPPSIRRLSGLELDRARVPRLPSPRVIGAASRGASRYRHGQRPRAPALHAEVSQQRAAAGSQVPPGASSPSNARRRYAPADLATVYASAGSSVKAPPCKGRTTRKWRSSKVRRRRVPSLPAMTATDRSARPRLRSAYRRSRSSAAS